MGRGEWRGHGEIGSVERIREGRLKAEATQTSSNSVRRSGIANEELKKARSLLYLGFSLDRVGFMGLGTKNAKNIKFELPTP